MSEAVNPYNAGVPPALAAADPAQAYRLSIDFELTAEDVAAIARSSIALRPYLRQRRILAYRLMTLGLLVAAGWLFYLQQNLDRNVSQVLAVMAAVLLVRGGYLLAFSAHGLRRALARRVVLSYQEPANHKLLGWRHVSIDPAGIRQSASLAEAFWKWNAIEQIELVDDYLLLHIGSVQSLVIPHRAFHTDAHFRAFLASAREFHQQASEIKPAG
jgi:YcxB-like protein